MCTDLCLFLLPNPHHLRVETITLTTQPLSLHVTSIQPEPRCPTCGTASHRLHSGYVRTLADLPWAGRATRMFLQVRRFFCDQTTCVRRTFTERLPAIAASYAHRTVRLAGAQSAIGLALAGTAGARLAAGQGMPTSRNTLLRLVRALPIPDALPARIIGIDDWCQRKGHTYGTIIIDLERHQALDLLPDRTADTTAAWLRGHPGAEVISRDRAGAYASGATDGAPQAVQVADRFHLLKNLGAALEQAVKQCGTSIARTVPESPGAADATATSAGTDQAALAAAPPTSASVAHRGTAAPPAARRAEATRQARRSERYDQYQQLLALRQQGLDQPLLARMLGLSTRTVSRWLNADGFPERQPRTGATSGLDPYRGFLNERWHAGCHNGLHLFRELQQAGFTGSYGLVAHYLAPLRHGGNGRERAIAVPGPAAPQCYTAREAAFLFLRRVEKLSPSEQEDVAHLPLAAGLPTLYTLTQDFACMVRARTGARLDDWLERAASSPFPEVRRFVTGVRRDYAAVRAGLTLMWSQGQVEGNVTRLKLLKRQMYGRAKLDLLRQRVLLAG